MKVFIGPYKQWLGPYQLAEKLCFWAKKRNPIDGKYYPKWVDRFGEWLAHGSVEKEAVTHWLMNDRKGTKLAKLLTWIDKKKKRKVYVKIDRWDTWSMDHTLALIVLPMLKQLKNSKHGYAFVDHNDCPVELQWTEREDHDIQMDLFEVPRANTEPTIAELRWDWVLDEMIFAFEHMVDETWEDKFYTGETDWAWTKIPSVTGTSDVWEMGVGPNHTYKCDHEGLKAVTDRIDNGLRLFGKYYRALWD